MPDIKKIAYLLMPAILWIALNSCNSYDSFDPRVESSLSRYKMVAAEIDSHFSDLVKLAGQNNGYKGSFDIYYRQYKNGVGNNPVENPDLHLKQTLDLCSDGLVEIIMLNNIDSSILF